MIAWPFFKRANSIKRLTPPPGTVALMCVHTIYMFSAFDRKNFLRRILCTFEKVCSIRPESFILLPFCNMQTFSRFFICWKKAENIRPLHGVANKSSVVSLISKLYGFFSSRFAMWLWPIAMMVWALHMHVNRSNSSQYRSLVRHVEYVMPK